MDAGIDWFTLAITVPLVPTAAALGALFWSRTGRPKGNQAAALDESLDIRLVDEPETAAPDRRAKQPTC